MATTASETTVSPSTSWTLTLAPNPGGWAYRRYVLRDPVASSTGTPNRLLESEPPATRSSPLTVGPAFSRSTAMANHEPWRT